MLRRVSLIIAVSILAATVFAGSFVSFRGKFFVNYPADWKQIDYLTVDAFLQRAGARRSMLDYEAVFAPTASQPWYQDCYLILTVDTLGTLTEKEVDSVIVRFEDSFEKTRIVKSTATLMDGLTYGQIAYDPANRTAAVISSEAGPETGDKSILLVMHFFEHGIANYYFFAGDSAFQSNLPVLKSIVASFSTENIEQAMSKETARVADAAKIEKATKTNDSKFPIWAPTTGGALLIVIIAFAAARRKKRQRQA